MPVAGLDFPQIISPNSRCCAPNSPAWITKAIYIKDITRNRIQPHKNQKCIFVLACLWNFHVRFTATIRVNVCNYAGFDGLIRYY